MPDDLAEEIESVEKACHELSLTVVPGSFDGEKMPTISWETTGPNQWKSFLTLAKSLGCRFVVVEKYEFDEEAIEYHKPEGIEADNHDDFENKAGAREAPDLEAEWDELKSKYTLFYGSLYMYMLHCFEEGLCHTYEREATWYEQLLEEVDRLKERLEAAKEGSAEEETPDLTDKEMEEIASTLARDELFQKATNQGSRRFALKKRHPNIFEEHPRQVSEIIDHAKGILELEVKPQLEKALDKQIIELSEGGLNRDQIARKLSVPVSRVRKAL